MKKRPMVPIERWKRIEGTNHEVRHGKVNGRPSIATPVNRPGISEVIERLQKAGILIPETEITDKWVISSRIGSRRKPVQRTTRDRYDIKRNTLSGFMKRFALTLDKGRKPDLARANTLLENAARTIARMHMAGVIHGHPHFGNLIPVGNRIALIDFKKASLRNISWEDSRESFAFLYTDFAVLKITWNNILQLDPNKKTRRMLNRMEAKFFFRIVEQYPMTKANKKKLWEYLGINDVIEEGGPKRFNPNNFTDSEAGARN